MASITTFHRNTETKWVNVLHNTQSGVRLFLLARPKRKASKARRHPCACNTFYQDTRALRYWHREIGPTYQFFPVAPYIVAQAAVETACSFYNYGGRQSELLIEHYHNTTNYNTRHFFFSWGFRNGKLGGTTRKPEKYRQPYSTGGRTRGESTYSVHTRTQEHQILSGPAGGHAQQCGRPTRCTRQEILSPWRTGQK